MPFTYRDFAIDFIPAREGGLLARVASSPAGEGASIGWIPIPTTMADEIAGIARAAEARFEAERRGENVDRAELDGPSAVALGAQLFTNLFSGRIRSFFDESLGRLRPSGEGLRIKLQLDLEHPEVAALHGLPWEFLNDAEQAHPLGLDLRFSIVRHVPQRRSIVAVPLPRPFRILCASAEPRGQPLLALEDELRKIVEALHQPGEIEVRPLPGATLESIRRELTGPDEFHVLHFMGHGEFDPESGDGVLYLENGKRGAAIVPGGLLADHLRDRTSLRLVFLNACRTARAAAPSPFGGVATSLVRAGVPAVIAMQFPITDGAAVAFSETVYRRIAAGDPIDAAVTEGRIAIRTRAPRSTEWGTPVLFSHTPDGRLFEATAPPRNDLRPEVSVPPKPRSWKRLASGAAIALVLGILGWKIPGLLAPSGPNPEKSTPAREEPVSPSSPTGPSTGNDPWSGCATDVDSFEHTSSFPLRLEPQGEYGMVGGEFKLSNAAGSGTQKRCKYCPTTARRFRVGALVKMTTDSGTGGIYFLDDVRNTRGYSLEIDHAGVATFKRYVGDLGKILWQGTTEGGRTAQLSAEVTPAGIVAIVNGRRSPIQSIDPATLPAGPHEVGMILAGSPSEVYFDDLTLTACE